MIEIWNGTTDLRPLAESWAKEVTDIADIEEGMRDLTCMKEGEYSDVFVLKHEDKIVGLMGIVVLDLFFSKEFHSAARYWYILPKYRSLARELVNYAKKWSREKGCSKIMLGSNERTPDNYTIDKFYEAIGFKKHETIYVGDL